MSTFQRALSLKNLLVLTMLSALFMSHSALANGLGENRPWQFTYKDKVRLLELQELKNSGFYDQQNGAAGGGAGDTIIYGDQINCTLQSTATANSNVADITGTTGSYSGVQDSDILAETVGTENEAWNDGDGNIDIDQQNTGALSSTVDNSTISSSVDTFTGGGTTTQNANNTQSADHSTQTSTVTGNTVCDAMTVN